MLSQEDKIQILNDFPSFKLSYEIIGHKKVCNSDLILAIPEGKKCFVYFTEFNNNFSCILLELANNEKKQICDVKIVNCCFSKSLCYGTIFYGTYFTHIDNYFFSIEDIFICKGKNVSNESWCNKFNIITSLLKNDIKQIAFNRKFLIFGLPVIAYQNEEIEQALDYNIKYKIKSIQYYKFNKINSYVIVSLEHFRSKHQICEPESKIHGTVPSKSSSNLSENNNTNNNNINKNNIKSKVTNTKNLQTNYNSIMNVFEIKPDIQNDIYHLYALNNEYYGIACIPDYKTSVMMNGIFRNIKENIDLDKLEESDDEDEFENPNVDKFVYLNRSFKFICNYNKKFKKWVPVQITE